MPTQLQLEWPDNKIETFTSLDFIYNLKIEEHGIFFAELHPPLLIGKEELKCAHFINFSFFEKSITFFTPYPNRVDFPPELNFFKISLKLPGK
jgi:hypothetical protein